MNFNKPPRERLSSWEEPECFGLCSWSVGAAAPGGGADDGNDGISGNGSDGLGGVATIAGLVLLEQAGKGCLSVSTSSTPSMPWHLIEDPAVHRSGLEILTLLRKKLFLPSLEMLSI